MAHERNIKPSRVFAKAELLREIVRVCGAHNRKYTTARCQTHNRLSTRLRLIGFPYSIAYHFSLSLSLSTWYVTKLKTSGAETLYYCDASSLSLNSPLYRCILFMCVSTANVRWKHEKLYFIVWLMQGPHYCATLLSKCTLHKIYWYNLLLWTIKRNKAADISTSTTNQ